MPAHIAPPPAPLAGPGEPVWCRCCAILPDAGDCVWVGLQLLYTILAICCHLLPFVPFTVKSVSRCLGKSPILPPPLFVSLFPFCVPRLLAPDCVLLPI